jgi:hypothetical protein
MSFVVKDVKSGRVLVRDTCVFDPDLNKFSEDVLDAIDNDDAEDEVKDKDQLVQIDDVPDDGILRFQTVTYRMYICTFVAKRADGRIVLSEEKL